MATTTSIPLSEYLATSYRPDCDYIDGEVKERTLGERSHAMLQLLIAAVFQANWRAWSIVTAPELRVRVSPTRVRIPDICVMRRSDPPDPVVLVAPLICIEVLSPGDSLRSLRDRIEDYFAMGVENVWLIDPITRKAHIATAIGYDPLLSSEFTVPGTPILISLKEVFAELDDMLAQD
jgi:Uma2 family endonuclease